MVEERETEVDRARRALGDLVAVLDAVRRREELAGRRELPAARRRRHIELDMVQWLEMTTAEGKRPRSYKGTVADKLCYGTE